MRNLTVHNKLININDIYKFLLFALETARVHYDFRGVNAFFCGS